MTIQRRSKEALSAIQTGCLVSIHRGEHAFQGRRDAFNDGPQPDGALSGYQPLISKVELNLRANEQAGISGTVVRSHLVGR